MTIGERVRILIAEHLGIDAASVTDAAFLRDDLGTASLDVFDRLLAFEETFCMEVPTSRGSRRSSAARPPINE